MDGPLLRSAPAPRLPALVREGTSWVTRFEAMGSPCEVLVDTDDLPEARAAGAAAAAEAWRIEARFSRYRHDSVIARIHAAAGATLEVDDETAALLDFAEQCHTQSAGAFDVTTGILRRAWRFDGGAVAPTAGQVEALLPRIGWHRVRWERPRLTLPAGMELDLGGIGKEYAVDRAATCASGLTAGACLVNFGGDLLATGPRRGGVPWVVGIDDPAHTGRATQERVELERGALATSGDARRFVIVGGRRYGHILDPRTGWPVAGAPRSVTVLAASCSEAGALATLAMLQGSGAEAFLAAEGVTHRVIR